MDTAGRGCLTRPVRFTRVTLQGFRNLPLAEVELAGRRTFLCGANAQGKTNFLEALGYVTALRSFRGAERGPHRDDLDLLLNGRPARQFASEGQQRCLVIALRLAQAAYFKAQGGVTPVLLCDDVLGELDPSRRARFWASLDPAMAGQVIATGTSLPEAQGWQLLRVEGGQIQAA